MNLILEGKLVWFGEFFNGNLPLYTLVFFDIVKLALEITNETGGV